MDSLLLYVLTVCAAKIMTSSGGFWPGSVVNVVNVVNVGVLDCERINEYARYREDNAFSEGAF